MDGLLDIPQPRKQIPPSTMKKSPKKKSPKKKSPEDGPICSLEAQDTPHIPRKCVPIADINVNGAAPNKSNKKRRVNTGQVQEPSGVIIDLAPYSPAQKTTADQQMAENCKVTMQTVRNLEKFIAHLQNSIDVLTKKIDLVMGVVQPKSSQQVADHSMVAPTNTEDQELELTMSTSNILPQELYALLSQVEQVPVQVNSPMLPLPIPKVGTKFVEMPSWEINRENLQPICNVLQKYAHLRSECKIGVLAVKLAREAIFGDDVLKRCTPRG